jgi:hypothetical protein
MGCTGNLTENLGKTFKGKPLDVLKKQTYIGTGYIKPMADNSGAYAPSDVEKAQTLADKTNEEYQKTLNQGLAASDAAAAVAPQDYETYAKYYPQYQQVQTDTAGKQMFGQDWTGTANDLYQQLSDSSSKFNIGQMAKYGDAYAQQVQGSNPELYKQMSAQDAMIGNLSTADGSLSAQDTRDAQQSARAGYDARGLSGTNGSLITEAMNTDAMKRQRLAEGITARQGSINNWQTNKVNPWDIINGNQVSGTQNAASATQSNSVTSNAFMQTQNQQWDTLLNAGAANTNSAANNDAAKKSSQLTAGASIVGGIIAVF